MPATRPTQDTVFTGTGVMVNSGEYYGHGDRDGKAAIIARLEERGIGKGAVNYRMRDWLVSRQRYWGAPIPIVYCPSCGTVPVPEDQLPVMLPHLEHFEPGDDGRSPLATDPNFVHTVCPTVRRSRRARDRHAGHVRRLILVLPAVYQPARRSTRRSTGARCDYWCPLDLYVGGAEHAVMHLLYFRFFTKVLADAGLIDFREPAPRLKNQGVMHAPDGRRMSKSKHNVITPDSVAAEYGADTLRGYILFMAPFSGDAVWDPQGINGISRWLHRVWDIARPVPVTRDEHQASADDVRRAVHKTVKKVGSDLESFQFNTAISALMELTNLLQRTRQELQGTDAWAWSIQRLLVMIAPMTPHIAEELWHQHGFQESIHLQSWPEYDEGMTMDDVVTVVVQVNGKLRDRLEVPRGEEQESVNEQALASPRVLPYVTGREVMRVITVPDKLVNIVVK